MAKKLGYSIYTNFMDLPFKFQGHFSSKKEVEARRKELRAESLIQYPVVVREAKPPYTVGENVTGLGQPLESRSSNVQPTA